MFSDSQLCKKGYRKELTLKGMAAQHQICAEGNRLRYARRIMVQNHNRHGDFRFAGKGFYWNAAVICRIGSSNQIDF